MKNNSEIILSITLFFTLILNVLNSEPVSKGSTVYYSTNNKCSFYENYKKICLNKDNLYNIDHQITQISNYLESNYYELNLYKTDNDYNNYIHCIITFFSSIDELIFKYYHINIDDNTFEQKDSAYYNTSLKPLNKGINCQTKDRDYQFICFYFNKDKDVVKMDIKNINNTINVTVDFQVGKINNKDNLYEGNIMILSSLFKDKYKFHYQSDFNSFYIHFNKKTEFVFSQDSNNEFEINEFKDNIKGQTYAFVTFDFFN